MNFRLGDDPLRLSSTGHWAPPAFFGTASDPRAGTYHVLTAESWLTFPVRPQDLSIETLPAIGMDPGQAASLGRALSQRMGGGEDVDVGDR